MSKLMEVVKANTQESLNRIKEHPFITQAHEQLLSKDQAKRWIFLAGRESRAFPLILENMIGRCSDPVISGILKENLEDEYGRGNPEEAHFKHYLHLLDDLGVARIEFEHYKERAGILLALDLAYNVSVQENNAIALGYMIVNEGMTPITYGAARSALAPFFPDMRTRFFDLHVEVDALHVQELYRTFEALHEKELNNVLFGVSIGERGMAVLLDEALGVFDYVPRAA